MASEGGGSTPTWAQVELGVTLRRLRREHGLSQRDLARPLHLGSHSAIAAWEAGRRPPPTSILAAYERHFDLAPGSLLGLRERVLAERAAADAHAALRKGAIRAAPVPRQLPGTAADFIGRVATLAELDRMVRQASKPTALVIFVIGGMAGVGKTALAVNFAHRVAGWFPDGQLYVNLRGFDPSGQPVSPAAAICGFLDALAVPRTQIPADLDAQAGLYRSLLAGRRVLILADNARDTSQVRPLLPGTPGCLVLVTSRNQLTSLAAADGAQFIDLDMLTPDEARQLLAARLGPRRLASEPGAVADIITACGQLPLALAIMAARAAARPGFPLSALAAELRERPLDALATGDDPATDLRAVFTWSYHALSAEAARLFRLLGQHLGPDISTAAAASLAGQPPAQARPMLAELVSAHLIGEQFPGRYALHDLIRAYADHLARS